MASEKSHDPPEHDQPADQPTGRTEERSTSRPWRRTAAHKGRSAGGSEHRFPSRETGSRPERRRSTRNHQPGTYADGAPSIQRPKSDPIRLPVHSGAPISGIDDSRNGAPNAKNLHPFWESGRHGKSPDPAVKTDVVRLKEREPSRHHSFTTATTIAGLSSRSYPSDRPGDI